MLKSHVGGCEWAEGYHNFTADERNDFYKKAQGLCGSQLQKMLTETITESTIKRITESTSEEGDFVKAEKLTKEWEKRRSH